MGEGALTDGRRCRRAELPASRSAEGGGPFPHAGPEPRASTRLGAGEDSAPASRAGRRRCRPMPDARGKTRTPRLSSAGAGPEVRRPSA